MQIRENIAQILKTLPDKPGCYLMKNTDNKIIYVGKAKNLKNRVRSYFHSDLRQDNKTRKLVFEIRDIEWIVVGSELEALILEMNLIKRHRPKFNVRLKDDKRYPYIKVTLADPFPKVLVTRNMLQDGSRYFGPFTSAWAVYQTLDVLRRIFPYLTCDREITGKDKRPCLYYDIKLCTGPCIGAIDQTGYRDMIDDLMAFLSGGSDPILSKLSAAMNIASQDLNFEKAAVLRDRIKAVQSIIEKQKVVFPNDYLDSDVLAIAREEGEACVQVFFVRQGKLIGREYFILEGTEDSPDSEILSNFIQQFYSEAASIPDQMLLPEQIEEAQIISQWLRTQKNGKRVELKVPRRGQSRDLIQIARENATETLAALRKQWEVDTHKQETALIELSTALGSQKPLNRIECYDISHTQGIATVGSMIVFEQGVPAKRQYRKFNINSTSIGNPDDFASMEEVLRRRFNRWLSFRETESVNRSKDESFSYTPDLIVIDGGKGQLGRVVKVLREFNLLESIQVIGLAKREEEIFFPNQSEPLKLPDHSPAYYLLQRIRDEAHRFGITSHRQRRGKIGLASQLETIPGVGPTRRKRLLLRFGSIDNIKSASIEELSNTPGISVKVAESIKSSLE